jgi:pilus assembly protein Flp/PilA
MKSLYLGLQRFINDEEGVTAIEYALIAALIAVVIIAAVTLTGQNVRAVFEAVAAALTPAGAGGGGGGN